MASTLENRMEACADRMLRERAAQAILEAGKVTTVDRVVAGVVAVAVSYKKPTDTEIIEFVAGLP
jgi:hypothetical protein